MDRYVTLYNVIDTRTGKFHSVVVVRESNARFFVPAVRDEKSAPVEEPETIEETPEADEDAEEVTDDDE